MLFEGDARSVEHFRGPAQVAGGERDFRFGYDASGAGHGFFWTEGARSIPQEFLRPREIAKLRHRDAAKRKRRRIVRAARLASKLRGDRPPQARELQL